MKLVIALAVISVTGIARADTQTSYKAEVEAEHVEIEPRLTGPIKRVAVRDGQFVAKGDVLVELDDTQVRASFAAATADVSAKQAELAAAEAAATSDHSELAKANLDLARARVQQAQAVRDLAELEVGYTTIKAEISGLLALHTGGGVERFHAIGTITDVEHAWVTASFTEPQVATIKPGQVANVAIGKLDIRGTVDRVNSEDAALVHAFIDTGAVGNARVGVGVKIQLDRHTKSLRPGMTATVTIHTK